MYGHKEIQFLTVITFVAFMDCSFNSSKFPSINLKDDHKCTEEDIADRNSCPLEGWVWYMGLCYYAVRSDQGSSWDDAKRTCRDKHQADATQLPDKQFVQSLVKYATGNEQKNTFKAIDFSSIPIMSGLDQGDCSISTNPNVSSRRQDIPSIEGLAQTHVQATWGQGIRELAVTALESGNTSTPCDCWRNEAGGWALGICEKMSIFVCSTSAGVKVVNDISLFTVPPIFPTRYIVENGTGFVENCTDLVWNGTDFVGNCTNLGIDLGVDLSSSRLKIQCKDSMDPYTEVCVVARKENSTQILGKTCSGSLTSDLLHVDKRIERSYNVVNTSVGSYNCRRHTEFDTMLLATDDYRNITIGCCRYRNDDTLLGTDADDSCEFLPVPLRFTVKQRKPVLRGLDPTYPASRRDDTLFFQCEAELGNTTLVTIALFTIYRLGNWSMSIDVVSRKYTETGVKDNGTDIVSFATEHRSGNSITFRLEVKLNGDHNDAYVACYSYNASQLVDAGIMEFEEDPLVSYAGPFNITFAPKKPTMHVMWPDKPGILYGGEMITAHCRGVVGTSGNLVWIVEAHNGFRWCFYRIMNKSKSISDARDAHVTFSVVQTGPNEDYIGLHVKSTLTLKVDSSLDGTKLTCATKDTFHTSNIVVSEKYKTESDVMTILFKQRPPRLSKVTISDEETNPVMHVTCTGAPGPTGTLTWVVVGSDERVKVYIHVNKTDAVKSGDEADTYKIHAHKFQVAYSVIHGDYINSPISVPLVGITGDMLVCFTYYFDNITVNSTLLADDEFALNVSIPLIVASSSLNAHSKGEIITVVVVVIIIIFSVVSVAREQKNEFNGSVISATDLLGSSQAESSSFYESDYDDIYAYDDSYDSHVEVEEEEELDLVESSDFLNVRPEQILGSSVDKDDTTPHTTSTAAPKFLFE